MSNHFLPRSISHCHVTMQGDGVVDCFGHASATFVANAESMHVLNSLVTDLICDIRDNPKRSVERWEGEGEGEESQRGF